MANYFISQDGEYYSILESKYNTDTKQYNVVTKEELLADSSLLCDASAFTTEVTIGEETFKPIDKFNNFKILSIDEDNINVSISLGGLIITNSDISLEEAGYIDSLNLDTTISGDSNIYIIISKNSGKEWYSYIDSKWEKLNIKIPIKDFSSMDESELQSVKDAISIIKEKGILCTDLETVDFNSFETNKIRIAYLLNKVNKDDSCLLTEQSWKYDEKGELFTSDLLSSEIKNSKVYVTSAEDMVGVKVNIII